MKIGKLCIANGDEYENVLVELSMQEMIEAINKGEVIKIQYGGKQIALNSEFIVSFEIGESKSLSVI